MARRLGRKKAPLREDYMLNEQKKVDELFDAQTMIYLSKFFNKGIISRLEFKTASGKESDIYLASPGQGLEKDYRFVVLKFFRIETSLFSNMSDYIIGDPRFSGISGSKAKIINVWCRKELGNLLVALKSGVRAPKPFMANGNILAMEFIGDSYGVPAPPLYKTEINDPESMLDRILGEARKLYVGELVHADLSEYNVLIKRNAPCIIDFGQAVSIKHPKAMEFLHRDVSNMVQYFSKRYGVSTDEKDAFGQIIS